MSYLFGDSTPSTLTSNFIELLRDALDFAVHSLLAEERIRQREGEVAAARRDAERELGRLSGLRQALMSAMERADRGAEGSIPSQCADVLRSTTEETVAMHEASVTGALGSTVESLESIMAEERVSCVKALETLVLRHDPPGTTNTLRLGLVGAGYVARLDGATPYGLEFGVELEVPATHAFAHAVRVNRLMPQLEVQAPEMAGWIRKETRMRPQRLDRSYVTSLSLGNNRSRLSVRFNADGTGPGFDMTLEGKAVGLKRVGETAEDVIDLELSDEDAEKLRGLFDKVAATLVDVSKGRRRLLSATLDGEPLETVRSPSMVVNRVIAAMAPIVKEISARSLTPTELVLKRMVAGNRREELFVPKAELLAKLDPLPSHARERFAALPLMVMPSMMPPSPSMMPPSPSMAPPRTSQFPRSRASAAPPPLPTPEEAFNLVRPPSAPPGEMRPPVPSFEEDIRLSAPSGLEGLATADADGGPPPPSNSGEIPTEGASPSSGSLTPYEAKVIVEDKAYATGA